MNTVIALIPIVILLYYLFIVVFIILKILRNNSVSNNSKIVWTLVLICFPIVGLLAYYIFNKRQF